MTDDLSVKGERPTNGNESSRLREVLAEFGPQLWRMTFDYASDRADREDLFQEISVALWKALPTFRGDSTVRTFVYRVARNRCLSFRARSRRRGSREILFTPDDSKTAVSGVEPTFTATLEEEQRSCRLRAAVKRLPDDLRRTLLLRLDGLSDQEIGGRLGITANATAVRLFRARQCLRSLVQPKEFGY